MRAGIQDFDGASAAPADFALGETFGSPVTWK
jgi:hypothetical protein